MAIDKELFTRTGNASDIINKDYRDKHLSDGMVIDSWDDFFKGVFGEPVGDPVNVKVYVKRHLPAMHKDNPYQFEVVFPYQFGFDTKDGSRWFGVLYDLGRDGNWQFLLFKPNRQTYLEYLLGQVTLLQLYQTTADFYMVNSELGSELIHLRPVDLTENQLPLNNAFYGYNIVFDSNDFFFGRNTADVKRIIFDAELGRF